MLLPQVRARVSRGNTVFLASLASFSGIAVLAASHHWLPAAAGMMLFGVGWVTASAVAQSAAQLAAPPWVRARALAIYQLAFNFALGAGTFFWGWLGTEIGLQRTLVAAAATGLAFAIAARPFDLDRFETPSVGLAPVVAPVPHAAVAPELAPVLKETRGRVLETQHYRIDAADRDGFLALMAEVRDVRGRAGALVWQLYEDVAHADVWIEVWTVENWTDHLREALRMSEADHACVGRAAALHRGERQPPCRYIAVPPHRVQVAPRPAARRIA